MKKMLMPVILTALTIALAGCPLCPKVTIEPGCATLKTGDELPLKATSPNSEDVFTWTSGNEMIARVDETGLVTVWAPGAVEITATGSVSGLSGSCLITVLNRGSIPGPMVLGVPYEFTLDIDQEPGEGVWTWSGVGTYIESNPGTSGWIGGGDAMGWNAGADGQWELTLDWPFVFDGEDYSSVTVTNTGKIIFGEIDEYLYLSVFGADLSTELEGQDIFVTQTESYATIRWACALAAAERKQDGAPINFEAVLYRTGEIGFNYGVVSLPAGDAAGKEFMISPFVGPRIAINTRYTGASSDLHHAASIPPGTSRVWTYDPGRTPTGLSLSAEGVISGTPTEAGDFMYVVHYFVEGNEVFYGLNGAIVYEEMPDPAHTEKK